MMPYLVEHPYIHFKGTSGYSRHGDTVSLFVDRIDNLNDTGVTSGNLSLQLWACQSPYTGGDLTGRKLAEVTLGVLQAGYFMAPVNSEVTVSLPESGDFAVTLVITEWDGEGFNRIHDFHNYPCRDVFLHPLLEGVVGYRCIDRQQLVVEVERIRNPRDPNNMSGTLALELWALTEPYVAGDFQGYALAGITLGSLAGGESWENGTYDIVIVPPPADTYNLILMLREWTGNGYVTRDHCTFNNRVSFPISLSATQVTQTLIADEPAEPVASPVPSCEHTGEATPAVLVGNPTQETGSQVSQNAGPARTSHKGGSVSVQTRFNNLKRSAQRFWGWLKRHW